VKEVVVKRGADSCLVSIAGEGLVDVPAAKLPKEKVIDTTAAGDSFSAGYLAVRLTGGSAENAAKRGHLTASTVIQYRGAIIPREASVNAAYAKGWIKCYPSIQLIHKYLMVVLTHHHQALLCRWNIRHFRMYVIRGDRGGRSGGRWGHDLIPGRLQRFHVKFRLAFRLQQY
jgi:hypothetical protein